MRGPWSDTLLSALRPRERLPVSEWADRYRYVSAGTSPEPGQWRTARTPYLREVLDAISDPAVERVALMCGSQLGKSEVVITTVGYFAHQDPAGVLIVQPSEFAAKSFSKERIEPMFRDSPALRGLLEWGGKAKDNEILIKQYPGGYMAFAWAGSATSLASRPIRVVLMDEVDRYPPSTGKDGDPILQAEQRTANFANRKIVLCSTPTIDGVSPIAEVFAAGDQRYYHVPCPHCGTLQPLEWERLVYKRDGTVDLDSIHYQCEACEGRIEERHRPAMLDAGAWVADNPEAPSTSRSYQIGALYSPWVPWRTLVIQWLKALANRDRVGLREFRNLRLGLPWVEEDQVNAAALEKNRDFDPGPVPARACLITCGVDTQDNRLEVEFVGWGPGRESWGIEYAIIPGDTSIMPHDDPQRSPWARLDALIARRFTRADGLPMVVQCVAIDSGGHRTDEVYQFARERLDRNVFAVKGMEGSARPIVGKPTLNKLRAPLYLVGDDTAKGAIYSRLAIESAGPGYCHFPRGAGYDDEYFAGLTSEKRDVKTRGGRRVRYWKQLRTRNEPLDCRKYATAALEILAPDLDALAARMAAETAQMVKEAAAPVRPRPVMPQPAPPTGRRILSRGVEV